MASDPIGDTLDEYLPQSKTETQPGSSPGSLDNNIGNLKDSKGRFASYSSPEAGAAAALDLVKRRAAAAPGGKLNLYGLIGGLDNGQVPTDVSDPAKLQGGWAPATDKNDPVGYSKILGSKLGIDPYSDSIDPNNPAQMSQLLQGIYRVEHGPGGKVDPGVFDKVAGVGAQSSPSGGDPIEGTLDEYLPQSKVGKPQNPAPKSLEPSEAAGPSYGAANPNYSPPSYAASQQLQGPLRYAAEFGQDVIGTAGEMADQLGKAAVGLPPVRVNGAVAPQQPNIGISPILRSAGLVDNPATAVQSPTEQLANSAIRGGTGAALMSALTGGAGMIPAIASGMGGAVTGDVGGPPLAQATGLPGPIANLIASLPGAYGGGAVGGALNRAATAFGRGASIPNTVGALLPNSGLTAGVNPEVAQNIQAAKNQGVNIPAQYWTQDSSYAKTMTPALAQQTMDSWVNGLRMKGLPVLGPGTTLSEADIDQARKGIGNGLDAVAARSSIPAVTVVNGQMVSPLMDLTNDLGSLRQKVQNSHIGDGEMNRLNGVLDELQDQINTTVGPQGTGSLSGEAYQQLTNRGSSLDLAVRNGSADVKFFAAQIRDALDSAMDKAIGPQDMAEWKDWRRQWKNSIVLDPPARAAATTGIPDPGAVFNAVNKGYNGFENAGDLGDVARVGKLLPTPTKTGDFVQPGTTPVGNALSRLINMLSLGGGAYAMEKATNIVPWANDNRLLAGSAVAGAVVGAPLLKGVQNAQRNFLASPQGTQQLLDYLSGKTPTTLSPQVLGVGTAAGAAGQQP